MADTTQATRPSGGGSGLKKQYAGVPLWGWLAVGGVVVVAGFYLYRRNSAAQSAAQAGGSCTDANGNPGTLDANGNCLSGGTQASTFYGWMLDQQSSPAPAGTAASPPPTTTPTSADSDQYYHSHPKSGKPYASKFGRPEKLLSGLYSIAGKGGYYYHAHPKKGAPYWTLNGKKVKPPSGTLVKSGG